MVASAATFESSPTGFRARAIRLGLQVSGAALFLLSVETILRGIDITSQLAATVALTAICLAALAIVNWETMAQRPAGTILLGAWGGLTLLGFSRALTLEDLRPSVLLLSGVAIVFVAVISLTPGLTAFTVGLALVNVVIPWRVGTDVTVAGHVITVAAFAAVAAISRILTSAYRREVVQARTSLKALAHQEANFERLYEVSRTIAAGDSLANVVPQLVGRIGTYLDAEVGVVMLRDQTGVSLEVLSPIWAAGHSLTLSQYRISVQAQDLLAETYRLGEARIFRKLDQAAFDSGLLGELGLSSAMVAPLRVGGRAMGLIIVGDKRNGSFESADLQDLISLSAPAALVLAQLDRYKEAAETSRRMEELARMKTDFVSVVSHELRTPLTSIIGALATLARPELAPERPAAQELLTSARNQADRLRRLIEDLLMVSRIENRALPQMPEDIKLEVLLREVIATIPDAEGSVTIDVHPDAAEIEADADHLQRIVINLVQNAIKYAPGSPIEVLAVPADNQVIALSFVDHGPGIDPSARDRIFERFQQLEPSATRSQGGTGLGLNIVKGLATSMGGTIEITETDGGGATFTVYLPKAPGSLGGAIKIL